MDIGRQLETVEVPAPVCATEPVIAAEPVCAAEPVMAADREHEARPVVA